MAFFQRVYQVVRGIPRGKVATYGQVAQWVNETMKKRISPQIVGWALHANKDPQIPCHRVVNKEGKLAKNYAFGGWREQRKRLKEERVKVKGDKVDLNKCLYKFQISNS